MPLTLAQLARNHSHDIAAKGFESQLGKRALETSYEDALVSDATATDLSEEVIAMYRRQLLDENPASEAGDASGMDLVRAVGAARRHGGLLVPTVAGVLLFGQRLALRRLFPILRVDYIRVPGREWGPELDQRYESVDVREPLLVTFRRIYAAVVNDLPRSFTLVHGSPARRERLAIPESVVRETLVNALIHRDYRAPSTIQVLRYQDRIEVRNPGYSLVEDEQPGAAGSAARNPRIATLFRNMKFSENGGTAAIRKTMERAGLAPPLFCSNRAANQFVVTLFLP